MIDRRLLIAGLVAGVASPRPARAAQDGPVAAGTRDDPLRIRDLYEKDMSFTPLARRLAGQRISTLGYMAPPLKAESTFFVLTLRPMAVCPFCETEAQWPDDILAVYTRRMVEVEPFNASIEVTGLLALGAHTDPDTGFVSRVRLENAVYERVRG